MDTWDSEENVPPKIRPVIANQWEGEDEEEDVKDSWDDPEEEPPKPEEPPPKPVVTQIKKPKKALVTKIEEKEKKLKEELERKKQEKILTEMTPEEIRAEKLRQQKLQEEADLVLAKEIMGASDTPILESKEDFDKYKEEIVKTVGEATKNQNFPAFVEQLVQSFCVHLSAADLKKLHTFIGNLHIEKLKIEKGEKSKKSKGKGKAKLKLEGDTDFNEYSAYTEDYDDFM